MVDPILQALNAAETTGVAATLSGLSISTSSFLANLAKAHADKAKEAKEVSDTSQKIVDDAPANEKAGRQPTADYDRKRYLGLKALADDSARAMTMLLWAFVCFVADLVESLTFDPIVHKQAIESGLTVAGYTYEELLPVDVGFSTLSLGLGILLLSVSARKIFKIIPKIG